MANSNDGVDADAVYEAMDPLEPYTTGELAARFAASRAAIRRLLDSLAGDERIRKKEPEPDRTIWIREPPTHECPSCDERFEVKHFHPTFQAVQYCPACGTRLRRRA
ncbi:FeoC-like transcriptional regulator [Haloplanus aerogenes]|uniref:Transcriptional regulator HTH-type FeoC domain-containing protein n=1 Tax=Haloplanus aerogenes TaxID=660522 RepID=A0A3M0E738_9EURY|nr:hypothetical protein [Haloplanus aerogenes]RMB23843.1 hypothetical protein ATH50_1073 [Haloplanus aerogenes]